MRAVKYYWGVDSSKSPIYIEERNKDSWAIVSSPLVLNKQGEWEYEPMPSSRDKEFLLRCRYFSSDEACDHLDNYMKGNRL